MKKFCNIKKGDIVYIVGNRCIFIHGVHNVDDTHNIINFNIGCRYARCHIPQNKWAGTSFESTMVSGIYIFSNIDALLTHICKPNNCIYDIIIKGCRLRFQQRYKNEAYFLLQAKNYSQASKMLDKYNKKDILE